MKVWRIEDNEGVGPHSSHFYPIEKLVVHTHFNKPSTRNDFNYKSVSILQAKFGFTSCNTMIDWYNIYTIDKLFNIGYYISCYESNNYVISNSRIYVLFSSADSQLIKKYNEPQRLFDIWY